MTYKQEIEKIYKKLDSLAQRGDDSIMEYRDYIEEITSTGKYSIFSDVILTKYKINIEKYRTTEDIKKDLFKELKFQTKSRFLKTLSTLLNQKGVYNQGYHFYDSSTNKYIGDIREFEISNTSSVYKSEKLREKTSSSEIYYLQTVIGLNSSYKEALPKYDTNYIYGNLSYGTYSEVSYGDNFYECIQSYNWSFGNPITPTYSEYWSLISIPTYSVTEVKGGEKSLLEKYSEAIDIIKTLN